MIIRCNEVGAMRDVAETDDDILTLEIADDVLERAAAGAGVQVTTIGLCTHWYHCSWPL
jgi:hypothetical protein